LKIREKKGKNFELNVSNLQDEKFSSGKRTGELLRKEKCPEIKKPARQDVRSGIFASRTLLKRFFMNLFETEEIFFLKKR